METKKEVRVSKDLENNIYESIKAIQEYASEEMLELMLKGGVGATPDLYALPKAIGRFFRKFSEEYKKKQELKKKRSIELNEALELLDKSVIDKRNEITWTSLAPGVETTPKPELTLKSSVLNALCPALESVATDAFEIAKITTPVPLSLSLAGTISIPASPMAFGLLAILISKAGIASVCKKYNSSKK